MLCLVLRTGATVRSGRGRVSYASQGAQGCKCGCATLQLSAEQGAGGGSAGVLASLASASSSELASARGDSSLRSGGGEEEARN